MIRSYMLRPTIWLVVLLMLTVLLEGSFQKQGRRSDFPPRSGVDYTIEYLEGIQTNHEAITYRDFTATKMTHYSHENIAMLENVKFSSVEPEKSLLRVTADQAKLLGGGDDIFLSGNVSVLKGEDTDRDKILMVTEFLHVTPDADLANTDHAVTVFRMNSHVNSVGMTLNNQTGEIQLRSRVIANDKRGAR